MLIRKDMRTPLATGMQVVGYKVRYYRNGRMCERRFRGGNRALRRAQSFAANGGRLQHYSEIVPWLELPRVRG